MSSCIKVRAIAFYLPQFHPIPENDHWWGKGFTEWTNVTKARPLFPGHYQPHLPADLGFYDLRMPEVRAAQAEMARAYGIEGFCYWHYWFAGERLLERPFEEVLASGKPNFPFCLGWANETWSGLWSGGDERRIIKEQTYPGKEDQKKHFDYLLTAFRDPRYIRVEEKPLLLIYKPLKIPDSKAMLAYWRELALKANLPGLHIVATLEYNEKNWDAEAHGYDAITIWPLKRLIHEAHSCFFRSRLKSFLRRKQLHRMVPKFSKIFPPPDNVFDYEEVSDKLVCVDHFEMTSYPMAIPNWDTTARYGHNACILHNSNPDLFRSHFRKVLRQAANHPPERQIVFLKSWNEWAEGNYLEPGRQFGFGYLDVVKEELQNLESSVRLQY